MVPRAKAGQMTARLQCMKLTEKALATRAVPHVGEAKEMAMVSTAMSLLGGQS